MRFIQNWYENTEQGGNKVFYSTQIEYYPGNNLTICTLCKIWKQKLVAQDDASSLWLGKMGGAYIRHL